MDFNIPRSLTYDQMFPGQSHSLDKFNAYTVPKDNPLAADALKRLTLFENKQRLGAEIRREIRNSKHGEKLD